MAINDDIYKKTIRRRALLTMYEKKLANELDYILARHNIRLRNLIADATQLTASLQLEINNEIRNTYKKVYNTAKEELNRLYASEVAFNTTLLNTSLNGIYQARQVAKNVKIEDLILRDNKNLATHLASISVAERRMVTNKIKTGLKESASTATIISEIRKSSYLPRAQVSTLTRTAITEITNTASDEVYSANLDVIDGYQYVATLDDRTSIICARLDGKIFSVDSDGPRPPQHYNCRSTTIPVVKSADDLADMDSSRIKKGSLNKITERRRASIDGQVPARLTYEEWLKDQPNAVKLEILGSQDRVRIFNEGNLPLSKFSDAQGNLTSIEKLDKLSNM